MNPSPESGGYSSAGQSEVNGEEKRNEENSHGRAQKIFLDSYAALGCGWATGSSQRTETSFETPGSCIVTP